MKQKKDNKLSIVTNKIAKLNNPHLVLGGDGGLTTETRTKQKYKCIKDSKEYIPVIEEV